MHTQTTLETLPFSWYFDPEILEREKQTVFSISNTYIGARPMAPRHGSYYTLPRFGNGKLLLNNHDEVQLFSNICPHRGMLLAEGSGQIGKSLVCPMHRWSFGLDGQLIGAPHYPEKPCVSIKEEGLQSWNGLLFTGPRNTAEDLAPVNESFNLDVSHYQLGYYLQEEQDLNWKIPIEVYLDNYHIPYVHPGLNLFTQPSDWMEATGDYQDDWLVYQAVGANPAFEKNKGSEVYQAFQNRILQVNNGELPPYGIVLALYFPNTIIEWWPFMLVVTTFTPITPEKSTMVREYYFDAAITAKDPGYAALARQAFDESQAQDDVLHQGIQAGRKQGYLQHPDRNSGYPVYQNPTEDCVKGFHQRLMQLMYGLEME
jgi:phenylpropionate dioxygenase-like ring-hydroxylating dioxygenase large terminal subunit